MRHRLLNHLVGEGAPYTVAKNVSHLVL